MQRPSRTKTLGALAALAAAAALAASMLTVNAQPAEDDHEAQALPSSFS